MRKTGRAVFVLLAALSIASGMSVSSRADEAKWTSAAVQKVTVVNPIKEDTEELSQEQDGEQADIKEPKETESYVVEVTADTVNINKSDDSEEVLTEAKKGEKYAFVENLGNGWAEVSVDGTQGYIPLNENADIVKMDSEEQAKAEVGRTAAKKKRESVVKLALSMVGGRYRYGGSTPAGFDCSGFTQYVLRNAVAVSVPRNSASQASVGVGIDASNMQPGDLIFYGRGRSVNHVAIYIGNGKIVHASNPATGITVSPWNYRAPLRIANVLG